MDKILKAADRIVDVFQYLNREKVELNEERSQVFKILKELVEEKFTSHNRPKVQCQCHFFISGFNRVKCLKCNAEYPLV